jgi:hypothetical protein
MDSTATARDDGSSDGGMMDDDGRRSNTFNDIKYTLDPKILLHK